MWLHLPSECLVSPPASEDSTSLSEEQASRLARCAWSRGTSRQPAYWRRAWQTAGWMRVLSGVILPPSTADAGVAQWIASWRGGPARISVSLASVLDSLDHAGASGTTSATSSPQLSLGLSLGRTWPAICPSGLMLSPTTYSRWATGLRLACLLRRKSAPPTDESGCSSWPTARAEEGYQGDGAAEAFAEAGFTQPKVRNGKTRGGNTFDTTLTTAVVAWATPSASEDKYRLQGNTQASRGVTAQAYHFGPPARPTMPGGPGCSSDGPSSRPPLLWSTEGSEQPPMRPKYQERLPGESSQRYWERMERNEREHPEDVPPSTGETWPTPRGEDAECSGMRVTRGVADTLTAATSLWATATSRPRTHSPRDVDHGEQLANQVDMWQTPATDSFRSRGGDRKDEQGLDQQARHSEFWQTPHGFANTDFRGKTGGGGGEMAKQCVLWATPQANADAGSRNCEGSKAHQGTSLADQVFTGSSQTGRKGNTRRLNQRFVLWLMGFPPDWCDEIPRVDALRCAGNAVCPSQGSYAIAILLRELRDHAAAEEATA